MGAKETNAHEKLPFSPCTEAALKPRAAKLCFAGASKKLTEYLFTRHNVNAPPDGLLDVHYEMELVHILGIDELKQTMTVLVYVDEVSVS